MAGLPDAGRRIGLATIDALADLHLVDPAAVRARPSWGDPTATSSASSAGGASAGSLVATDDHDPVMTSVGERLERRSPELVAATILHNDFKTDNCQFRPGEPDRVTAVFDWDMATLGDPLDGPRHAAELLARPGRHARRPGLPRRRAWSGFGFPTAGRGRRPLRRAHGDRRHRQSWYEAFACWRTCVVLQQLHQRYVRGESTDERMATRGDHIGMLSRRAARILGRALSVRPTERNGHYADRPDRQGRRRHGWQPRPGPGDGARLRPLRRRRGRSRAASSKPAQPWPREVTAETGRRALPVACHVGRWADLDAPRRRRRRRVRSGRHPRQQRRDRAAVPEPRRRRGGALRQGHRRQPEGPVPARRTDGRADAAGRRRLDHQREQHRARHPQASDLPYAAAKAGLETLTVGFAGALGPTVRVNTIAVGPFLTDISKAWDVEGFERFAKVRYPLGRLGQPGEIVGTALYLARTCRRSRPDRP